MWKFQKREEKILSGASTRQGFWCFFWFSKWSDDFLPSCQRKSKDYTNQQNPLRSKVAAFNQRVLSVLTLTTMLLRWVCIDCDQKSCEMRLSTSFELWERSNQSSRIELPSLDCEIVSLKVETEGCELHNVRAYEIDSHFTVGGALARAYVCIISLNIHFR